MAQAGATFRIQVIGLNKGSRPVHGWLFFYLCKGQIRSARHYVSTDVPIVIVISRQSLIRIEQPPVWVAVFVWT